jgi:hypothetical protein
MRGFSWAAAMIPLPAPWLPVPFWMSGFLHSSGRLRYTDFHQYAARRALHIKSCRSLGKKMAGDRYAPNLFLFM